MRYTTRLLVPAVLLAALLLPAAPATAIHASGGGDMVLAEGQGLAVSFRGSIGILNGEGQELVYEGDHRLSALKWDLSGIIWAGGVLSCNIGQFIQLNAGYWQAINDGDGMMEDFDWLDDSLDEWEDWSHWSESEVEVVSAYAFDLNGMLRIALNDALTVYGVGGLKHNYFEWSDFGGRYIYSSYGWRDDIGDFGNENGIDYDQTFDIPYVGVGADLKAGNVKVSGYALYSPFVSAEDHDHHILRGLYFTETFEDGDFLALGAEVTVNLTDNIFIGAAADWQIVPEIIGDVTITDGVDFGYVEDGAGIETEIFTATVSAGIML